MADLREKILGGENALEKLMRKIPGFEGYKNREQTRNADKIQRDFMAKKLRDEKSRLTDLGQELLRSGNMMLMGDVDRVTKLFDKTMDRIEHAEYGYASLFAGTKINEAELDHLYEYDLSLMDNISRVEESVTALEHSIDSEEMDPKKKLKDVEKTIKAVNERVDGRQKILKGVE
ncbi:MAG: hypothetical protein ACLFQV_02660 [Vulcanimicrobiota bacterium]